MDMNETQSWEMVITRSGKYYRLTSADIALMSNEASRFFCSYITPGTSVGLFLNLDNLQLTSLFIYNALIYCGASVVRCGFSDLDRQIQMIGNRKLDYVITSASSMKYLADKIQYHSKFIVVNEDDAISSDNDADTQIIWELYDAPGIILEDKNTLICPGYSITKNEKEAVFNLSTLSEIQGFTIKDYRIRFFEHPSGSLEDVDPVASFIKTQVAFILNKNGSFPRSDGTLDSLGMVELLMTIEDEFKISISFEDVESNDLATITSLTKLLCPILTERTTHE